MALMVVALGLWCGVSAGGSLFPVVDSCPLCVVSDAVVP